MGRRGTADLNCAGPSLDPQLFILENSQCVQGCMGRWMRACMEQWMGEKG